MLLTHATATEAMEVVTVVAMAVKMEEDKAIAADAMEAMAEERGNPNGGGRNGGGGPRPTCQVCGKYGHDALRCRNRFNHAFQPDEPRPRNANVAHANNTSDSNWYFDSGATDHLTADLDRLSFQERYNGKDSVQVANGAGLHITHTGHSQITGSSRPLLNNILRVPNMSKIPLSVHKLLHEINAYAKIFPSTFMSRIKQRRPFFFGVDVSMVFTRCQATSSHHHLRISLVSPAQRSLQKVGIVD
jgi:hypothetical protein